MTTKLIRLVITDAQRDTIATALRIAIEQYNKSIEQVRALNGEGDLSAVHSGLINQIRRQHNETQAALTFFMPIVRETKVRAKPKRKR